MLFRFAQISLVLTLILVVVGVSVRVSGAGLGCPDWPRCWGNWIPSSEITDQQAKQHVLELIEKNKLAGPYDEETHRFDAGLMWIEYGNRLVGVLLGMVITGLACVSIAQIRRNPVLTIACFGAFLVVVFQGWLGAVVVGSGLQGSFITVHLFGALLLVGLLTWILQYLYSLKQHADGKSWNLPWRNRQTFLRMCWFIVLATWGQILLGSFVRDALGHIEVEQRWQRTQLLESIGVIDHVHRLFSWVILLGSGYFFWKTKTNLMRPHPIKQKALLGFFLVLAQMAVGVVLAYTGLPQIAQVAHVALAALLVTVQLWILFGVMLAEDPSGYKP